MTKARIFLLVDVRDFFIRYRVGDIGSGRRKKINKKALKMTSKLVIFRVVFFCLFF